MAEDEPGESGNRNAACVRWRHPTPPLATDLVYRISHAARNTLYAGTSCWAPRIGVLSFLDCLVYHASLQLALVWPSAPPSLPCGARTSAFTLSAWA